MAIAPVSQQVSSVQYTVYLRACSRLGVGGRHGPYRANHGRDGRIYMCVQMDMLACVNTQVRLVRRSAPLLSRLRRRRVSRWSVGWLADWLVVRWGAPGCLHGQVG